MPLQSVLGNDLMIFLALPAMRIDLFYVRDTPLQAKDQCVNLPLKEKIGEGSWIKKKRVRERKIERWV